MAAAKKLKRGEPQPPPRGKGRPIIPEEERETYFRLSMNIPEELNRQIEATAAATHRTKTGLVIWAIEELLKREGGK